MPEEPIVHKYTSYNKAWCDAIEQKLKAQGAIVSRSTEPVAHIKDKDGKLLEQQRNTEVLYIDAKLQKTAEDRTLYIVTSNKELKP